MNEFRHMKVKRLLQEVNIIAVVDEETAIGGTASKIEEKEIIFDSLRRPIPVPYSEQP